MKYIITGEFETDRELSSDELDDLVIAASMQIEEPTYHGTNDNIDVDVSSLKFDISKL